MCLDNSESNNEIIKMCTCDEAYTLNTFLVYHMLAALKYKGRYKKRHVRFDVCWTVHHCDN